MCDKFYFLVCNQLMWHNVADGCKTGVLPHRTELALIFNIDLFKSQAQYSPTSCMQLA